MRITISYRFVVAIMIAVICAITLRYALWLGATSFVYETVVAILLLFLALAVVLSVVQRARKLAAVELGATRSSTGAAIFTLRSAVSVDDAENNLAGLLSGQRWKRYGMEGASHFTRQKGLAGPLGSLIFHGGLIILLAGVAVSILASSSAMFALTEGERLTLNASALKGRDESPLAKDLTAQEREVTLMEFDRNFRIGRSTTPSALIEVRDGGQRVRQRVHVNEALELGDGTTLHRANFWGYSVGVVIEDLSGERIFSGLVRLAVNVEEGVVRHADRIALPDGTRLDFELYPDHVLVDGSPVSESNELRNPVLYLTVTAPSGAAESLCAEAGGRSSAAELTFAFPALREWSQFSLAYDPGRDILFLGAWISVIGLSLRLLFTRRRITLSLASVGGETQISLSQWRERYRTQHPEELERLFVQIKRTMEAANDEASMVQTEGRKERAG